MQCAKPEFMLKAVTWCAKCLFIYLIVVVLALRFAWVFALPVWSIATRMHWTQLNRFTFLVNYFLPIFATAGFILGLIPFSKLGRAIAALLPRSATAQKTEDRLDQVPPILWAWLPVTLVFLIRYFSWTSRNSSVLDPHANAVTGRFIRFFGTFSAQTPGMLDPKWGQDRFMYTGPMLFLIACAIAVYLRHRLTRTNPTTPELTSEP